MPSASSPAGLTEGDHPLNRPVDELMTGTDPELSQADMVRMFEHYVAEKLEPALETDGELIQFDAKWFLRTLLPEIHIGHLNLAEAMIYEAGHPLSASDMLQDLDLDAQVSEEAQIFALEPCAQRRCSLCRCQYGGPAGLVSACADACGRL